MRITQLDPGRPLDAAVLELGRRLHAEINPADPTVGPLELAGWCFGERPNNPHDTWIADLDGNPAGLATAETWNLPAHRQLAELHMVVDVDILRAHQAHLRDHGATLFGTLAIAPGGEAAGFTEIAVYGERPQLAHQRDTGVLAAHRGHRLGRWLKAANLRLALEHEPRIEVVETYNAESNPWMLGINVDMGYRPHVAYRAYQGSTTGALERLTG